jgi:hypothetical protein
MAARIYRVTNKHSGDVQRYVRANTLNGAIRSYADELFEAAPVTTDDLFQAMNAEGFDVLDAVSPEQLALGGGARPMSKAS